MTVSILLRGHLFRGCSKGTQIDLYKKMIPHVIKPLNKESKDINVIVVSYTNEGRVSFIEELFKPNVFKIAISLVFFFIKIVKPEIMLNAATINIKVNIINITFISTFNVLKKDLFKSDHEY